MGLSSRISAEAKRIERLELSRGKEKKQIKEKDENENNANIDTSVSSHPLLQKLRRVVAEYDFDGRKTGHTYVDKREEAFNQFDVTDAPVLCIPSKQYFTYRPIHEDDYA